MCPEPALLVAYLDNTLVHRDARDVDEHLATCRSCTDLLAAMQRVRAAEHRSKVVRWSIAGGVVAIAVVAIGASMWLRGSTGGAARRASEATSTESSATRSTSAAASSPPIVTADHNASEPKTVVAPPQRATPPAKANSGKERSRPVVNAKSPTTPATVARPQSGRVAAADAKPPVPVATPVQIDGDVIVRGRNANRGIIWRTRDRTIERSIDGGATWTAEYTADRAVRAGAFVDANVVWLVGQNGLVLRRTKNGWFAASAPDDANLTAVRASSPSKATVTLEDGRVFTSDNGGVTWSPQ